MHHIAHRSIQLSWGAMNQRMIAILLGLFVLVRVVMGSIVTPSEVMIAIEKEARVAAVSYTHLTLPTILLV